MNGLISVFNKYFFLIFLVSFSCTSEKSLIKNAREKNTLEAYHSYLNKYSDGKYADEAKQKIQDINFAHKRDSVFSEFVSMLEYEPVPKSGSFSIVPSNPILMGTRFDLGITGINQDEIIRLHAFRRFWDGVLYAYAVYESGISGKIALHMKSAIEGTYSGLDSLGLFWSMSWPTPNQSDLPFDVDTLSMSDIHIYLERDGKLVDYLSIELVDILPGVVSEQICNDTLVAGFYYPKNEKSLPAMILLSGSEGGHKNIDKMASVFASHDIAVLSLAYFNDKYLPEHLENIPLEYIYEAIEWLKEKPEIDKDRIFIAGGSRGGELALLVASKKPEIKAVIAVEPSCVLWQGLPHDPGSMFFPKPAWTENNRALPYLKHRLHLPTLAKFGTGARQIELLKLYEGKLSNASKIEPAFIKVEHINGPILLVAGKDDRLWPSYHMCQLIEDRLAKQNFKYPVEAFYYENAGHYVTILPDYSPTIGYRYEQTMVGGTDSGNAAAQIDSWNRIIEFIRKYLLQKTEI